MCVPQKMKEGQVEFLCTKNPPTYQASSVAILLDRFLFVIPVDPVEETAIENNIVRLKSPKKGQGSYSEIWWYKKSRASRIAVYQEGWNNAHYKGDFCPKGGTCLGSSPKGELNITTGELTIYSAELTDEDAYFYDFKIDNTDTTNTGRDYQISLVVYGKIFSR